MTSRKNISSGSQYEELVGYSRAVRVGNIIEIAGTTAIENNEIVGKDNAYEQTIYILQKIEQSLNSLDGQLSDIVRTRIFVTNINDWESIGRAHGEIFAQIKPVTTLVEIAKLVSEDMLVEIEATAILTE